MKKRIPVITFAVFAVAAAIAWRAHLRLAAARATLSTLQAEQVKLEARIAAATTQRSAQPQNQADVPAQDGHTRPAAAQTTAGPSDKPDTAMSLDKFPGLRALFDRSVAGTLSLRYGAFYRMAKLTPAQIQKFEQAMTETEETKMDFELAARAQGFKESDPALAQLRDQGAATLKAALIDALGPTAYDQYRQYRRIEPLTGIIGDMTTIAVQHDVPFTAAQADRLMTTIASASSTYQTGGKVEPLSVNWSQVLIEIAPQLSPLQLDVVRQEGDMQQVYQLLKQFYAQRKASGG